MLQLPGKAGGTSEKQGVRERSILVSLCFSENDSSNNTIYYEISKEKKTKENC